MENLNENLQIPEPYFSFLESVENVPDVWASHPLEDLPDLPQFNRALVVTGFNVPINTATEANRIFISVEQIWTLKESGKVFTRKDAPMWEISGSTWSFVRDFSDPTKLVELVSIQPDTETGEPIKTKSNLRVYTAKYLKFLILNKKAHLVDLFEQYLSDFAEAKKTELNSI